MEPSDTLLRFLMQVMLLPMQAMAGFFCVVSMLASPKTERRRWILLVASVFAWNVQCALSLYGLGESGQWMKFLMKVALPLLVSGLFLAWSVLTWKEISAIRRR